MMILYSILGVIPRGARTIQEVSAAGVSVKKELRTKLSTSDQLKLSKSAKEGGSDKFAFFEATGLIGAEFKSVNDLHMRIEALSKALVFFDMVDVFQIIDKPTVANLELHLEELFIFQRAVDESEDSLGRDPINAQLLTEKASASTAISSATT